MGKRTARSSGSQKAGSQVVRDLRERLGSGWPSGLTVLTGDDLYHLDEAQKLLLEALVPAESSEFALTILGEDRVDVAAAVGAARTVGMFSAAPPWFTQDCLSLLIWVQIDPLSAAPMSRARCTWRTACRRLYGSIA